MSSNPAPIPPEGSLGLLALGARGLDAWREVRGTDWIADRKANTPIPEPPAEEPERQYEGTSLTIVSGLPRSGTSMAMQMLVAGGLSPYTDALREADESNPKGYYEHEKIKATATDASWIEEADGLTAKVVAPLLPHLPAGPTYRIVFMERNLDELIDSQKAMLARDGLTAADAERLGKAYALMLRQAVEWAEGPAAPALLRLNHRRVIADPTEAATRIADFLGLPADRIPTMAAVVDPSLHRQRA